MYCAKCCNDLTLPVLALLFPTTYLDKDGLDFYRAHGLDTLMAKNEDVKFEYLGKVFTISILGLILPEVYLDEVGRTFYREQELAELLKKNGQIRILHKCQHLGAENLCDIYELRPQLCRSYDCSTRDECTSHPLEFRR